MSNRFAASSTKIERFALPSLLALAALLATGCRPKPTLLADQPVPVRTRQPLLIDEPKTVAASGVVEADVTAQTAFEISGRVQRVLVDEGQSVRQGQPLAQLDCADYRNARDAARGQALAARATANKAHNGLRPQELEQARIDFKRADDEYRRMKYLFDHQSLAANDFEKIEAAWRAAHERLQMAELGSRTEDQHAASGQAEAAEAQLHEAEKHVADCQLRAPIAGLIGTRKLNVGDFVSAGSPVMTVLALDTAKVRISVPESQINAIHPGSAATVTLPSLAAEPFSGRVDAQAMSADAASRTYAVKIAVPNRNHLLRAGMVAEARVEGLGRVHALTVPAEAVVRNERGVPTLWLLDVATGRLHARRVDLGDLHGSEVEITSGLAPADQVVVAGMQNVREGSVAMLGGAR